MLCWPQVPFPESESTLHSQRSWWQRQPHLASFPASSRCFLLSPGLTSSGHCLQTKVAHSHFFFVKVFLYCAKSLQPCLTLCNPWTHPALLRIGFSRQESRSGLPRPAPDFPDSPPNILLLLWALQTVVSQVLFKAYKHVWLCALTFGLPHNN